MPIPPAPMTSITAYLPIFVIVGSVSLATLPLSSPTPNVPGEQSAASMESDSSARAFNRPDEFSPGNALSGRYHKVFRLGIREGVGALPLNGRCGPCIFQQH